MTGKKGNRIRKINYNKKRVRTGIQSENQVIKKILKSNGEMQTLNQMSKKKGKRYFFLDFFEFFLI